MPWIKSCLCHQEKKKTPTISPPIHLLLKSEDGGFSQGPSHAFRCKTFKKPRPCHLCHQPILNEGSCCRVCKYVCHKVCESKEAALRYSDTSWRIFNQNRQKVPEDENLDTKDISETNNDRDIPSNGGNAPESDVVTAKQNGTKPKLKENRNNVDDGESTSSGNVYEKIKRPESRQLVQIEKMEVTYEKVKSPMEVDLVSCTMETLHFCDTKTHAHDESMKNGHEVNKMLRSTSYNGFGEALTSQPRSTRGGSSNISGGMDLSYVTERIISLWFPPTTTPYSYRQGQQQAAHMLTNKYGDNYMVFNLSEPKRALRNEHKHVKEVGWASKLAPPLEKLCGVCKEIDSWLSADQHRIAVLHARGDKDKLGVIVAAYMHYSSICGNAEQALDRFSMRKFLEDNVGPILLPSNRRYVEYFAGLLSRNIKINSAPMYLTHVTVLGAPSFQDGGCKAFLKLYEGHTPIYTSGVYSVSRGVGQFTVNVTGEGRKGLQLRGDILIKCYHRGEMGREAIFACQFHTCAVADNTLSFTRQELDIACNDSRFPADGAVELHFSPGPEGRHPVPAPTPAVPFTLTDDVVMRANSPLVIDDYDDEEEFDEEDVSHTFGPLDGSIYATIAKKPELSPGAVSSPLTVSMDSGISSAGHQQNANTNASTSPPLTAQPSPLTPEDQHRELDELLSDMMLTVQSIPDLKPHEGANLDDVRYIDEEEEKAIPYHARQTSQPFSYGVKADMIAEPSRGLSSPSLVRKASVNKSSGDTLRKVQTQVYPEFTSKSSTVHKWNPADDVFRPSTLNGQRREYREEYYREDVKRYDPLKRSLTEGTIRRSPDKSQRSPSSVVTSPYSDSESLSPPGAFRNSTKSPEFHELYATTNNLTWLQRQQQKLKERREIILREERQPHETRLLSELRSVQSRHMRPTASHRLDGYTSDTTAFADDDDDYTIPLHINTTHKNGSSTPGSTSSYSTLKSTYSTLTKNERPFMSVKRAHERYAQNSNHSPAQILAANPMGQIVRQSSEGIDQVDNGLLSLVEQQQQQQQQHYKQSSPRYNSAMVGIESENSTDSSPTDRPTDLQDESTRLDALSDLIANLSSGSDKSSNSPNTPSAWQYREDSVHSWRSQSATEPDTSPSHNSSPRPQTPAFPVHARTPYTNSSTPTVQFDIPSERLPPKSPTTQRKDRPTSPTELTNGSGIEYTNTPTHRSVSVTPTSGFRESENYQYSPKSPSYNGSSSPTVYYGTSRRSSVNSNNESPHEVSAANVKFVRDTSKYWYKPSISREQAISMLRDQAPGTFVVRDSNSFPGAFGLALRVATVPSNVQNKSSGGDELIRHYLIEPTNRGVRLKQCQNEPVFSSLSALIYQHSITQMALPCRLILPQDDLKMNERVTSQTQSQSLFTQGAACNVLYLTTVDMESLTGPQAIKKAVMQLFQKSPLPDTATVHFKVSDQGVTLTDNKRKLFFRRHYPINTVSYCGLDDDQHRWLVNEEENGSSKSSNRIFGFVARKPNVSNPDNQCHLFAELEPEQPATAIVNFLNKVLTSTGIKPNIV
ncbi:focal adhesion protein tensin isoform X6 [Leptinotarsa decemlineata]|uniref:focal adhesion protein tensin isoform X6 n=1 Tax=Leptinotarsa decemlineata TaxID=7539 RepID=UPI003D304012